MSDNKINKAVNQASVNRGIRQWFPPEGVRCALNSTTMSIVLLLMSLAQDKSSKAYLTLNIKSICRMSDFKTQEVTEMSMIFHLKLLTEKIIKFLNTTKVITSYNHIIHI